MLISWSGRGFMGLLVMIVPIGAYLSFESIGPSAAFAAMSLGLIVAGVLCFVLGRQWNRDNPIHRFGPFRLERWGVVYGVLGLILASGAIRMHLAQRSLNRP